MTNWAPCLGPLVEVMDNNGRQCTQEKTILFVTRKQKTEKTEAKILYSPFLMTSKLPTQPSDLMSPTIPKSTVKSGGLHSAHEPLRCPYQTTGSEAWKDTEIKKMEE